MLQAWLSIGYIVLLAILVLAFIYGAGGIPASPLPHSWWVFPFGLAGNTPVQHGQRALSRERKCAAAIPMQAAIRPTSNTSICATGPTGGSS